MTDKKTEALRLALEALELHGQQYPHMVKGYCLDAITAIREALAEQPEFIKHEVENADDWSEWVCPDPKGYLMKCCDCGLVHEAEFGVVRYKSETERENCDMVKDPNLQAVFRMRRSEQWTPKDTAYRPGGLAQPEQEPVAWMHPDGRIWTFGRGLDKSTFTIPLYTSPPAQRKPLTDDQITQIANETYGPTSEWEIEQIRLDFARAIEAAHGIKGDA